MNRNVNSYFVNSNFIDLETGANKTHQLHRVTLTPTIYIPNSSDDTPTLNVNETPIISKSANLFCIRNSTKLQNLNKHEKEQRNTETENLRAD